MSLTPTAQLPSSVGALSTSAIVGISLGIILTVVLARGLVMHYFGRAARVANAQANAKANYMRMNPQ